MKIITKKISSDKVGAVWYAGQEIAISGDDVLHCDHFVQYKNLNGDDALELIAKECKNDNDVTDAYDRRELFMWPDYMINGEVINATSYDEAIEEFKEFITSK